MEQEKDQNALEQIKKEILNEIKPKGKGKKNLPWNSVAVTVVLVVMALFSVVQTVQSANVLSKINSGAVKATTITTSAPKSSGTAPLPSSLQNLPNMVGGC